MSVQGRGENDGGCIPRQEVRAELGGPPLSPKGLRLPPPTLPHPAACPGTALILSWGELARAGLGR